MATVVVLALVGCQPRKPVPQVSVAPVEVSLAAGDTRASPGASRQVFVVFASQESYVIPVDPAAEVLRFPGLVVGDLDGRAARVLTTVPVFADAQEADAGVRVPYCADADADVACTRIDRFVGGDVRVEVRLGPQTTTALVDADGDACTCVSVDGLSDEGRERAWARMLEDEAWLTEELGFSGLELEEYLETCVEGDSDLQTVAVSGGRAYAVGEANERDCGGRNIYSLAEEVMLLRADVPTVTAGLTDARCIESTVDGGSVLGFWTELDADACTFGEDCCPDAGEAKARIVANGMSVLFAGDMGPMGGECGCIQTKPVSPATCASPLDPCGGDARFDAVDGMMGWWVANDEGAMLGVHDDTFFVYAPDRDDPLRTEALGLPLSSIYGVEVLPSFPSATGEIVGSVVVEIPVSGTSPDGSWGNECFRLFKAGRLAEAEGACVEGLLEGGTDKARGALTYTLGRIEQARGDLGRAETFYRRSLRLRPGNATVQAQLDALR